MSSPYIPHHGDYPDRHVASSPVHSTMTALDLQEPSIRPMRLKVLYTFDLENKTNCLARWPEILNIRTAHLDESTQIGVIELKTCIQAIVAASPEIVSKLDQDYTVYAYDYSEYETPQVGQGMLSRVLASASATPTAPAHQSDTIVTGRVCKSMLGLFANGIQETLEVKLRLVPVPTSLQNEYVESMKQQREAHHGIPDGVDPRAWNDFLKNNPSMMSVVHPSRGHSPATSFSQPQHGIEQVQRLVNEGYRPQSARPPSAHQSGYAGSVISGLASNRSGSPTPSVQSMATAHAHARYTRPASRASNEGSQVAPRRMSIANPCEASYEDEKGDEGPARKRAKVMKADHPGKSRLGKTFDTLRATASTAASIRVLQPTAVRPGAEAIRSLEAPPRAPTPTPGTNGVGRRPQLQATKSSLGRELSATSDSGYRSMLSEDFGSFSESAITSPENGLLQSDYNSPEEPTSSPPPMMQPPSMAPTSPMLPTMPMQESALNDCDLDDLFGEVLDHTDTTWMEQTMLAPSNQAIAPELPPLQHHSAASTQAAAIASNTTSEEEAIKEAKRLELSRKNARRAVGLERAQTWSGSSNRPETARPKPQRQRSVSKMDPERPNSRNSTLWNKEKRKQAMQAKLRESIDAGQMPPYCENCGAIETPTWRKAYSRIYSGDHSHLRTSNDEGGIVCIQVVETNEDGSTKLFKIFKKSTLPDDEGFLDVLLCNPCGIWLSTHKRMRPETQWHKKRVKAKDKKAKSKKRKSDLDTDASEPFSDGGALASESQVPPSVLREDSDVNPDLVEAAEASLPPNPSTKQPKLKQAASTAEHPVTDPVMNPTAFAALQRAIQSSPGRFLEVRKSPIDVDKESPDPARRSLFSSPKSGGPLGVAIGEKKNSAKKTQLAPKTPNEIRLAITNESDSADKENRPPQPVEINDLDELFSDFPATPSRTRNVTTVSPGALFKTPLPKNSPMKTSLATGDFFSSAAKAFLHGPRTPNKTPTRSSQTAAVELTPFTRHLNQLLSEPNAESPGRFLSEIGNLPYSMDSIPSMTDGGTPSRMFRSKDFDFSDFPSSDGPMPSSPPGWFGVYEDHTAISASWELEFGSSPAKNTTLETSTAEPAAGTSTASESIEPTALSAVAV